MTFSIRFAERSDAPVLLDFIKTLAEYEKLLDEVTATEAGIEAAIFDGIEGRRVAEALLAFEDETVVGFAIFFHNFSTFLGRPGLYLEDLFVAPQARGKGFGKALLSRLAEIALERGCGRMDWAVLDWNTPAIDFYKSLNAEPQNEWTVYRLGETEMKVLASG
jgi:GNAT superfamily N-acetyltransferase